VAHIYSLKDTYSGLHTKTVVNNEPPGSLYLISGTYEGYILLGRIIAKITHTQAGSILWVNTFFLHLWMRIPSILAELLLGIVAFVLVAKKKDDKNALLSASLIWFNPVIFYNGTLWGQMDSLNNVFFLISLFLAFKKKYMLSILSFAISLYIKLSLLPLLPFYFIFLYFISKKNIKHILISSIVAI
jgi:Gpi18-like mannosyltransferase